MRFTGALPLATNAPLGHKRSPWRQTLPVRRGALLLGAHAPFAKVSECALRERSPWPPTLLSATNAPRPTGSAPLGCTRSLCKGGRVRFTGALPLATHAPLGHRRSLCVHTLPVGATQWAGGGQAAGNDAPEGTRDPEQQETPSDEEVQRRRPQQDSNLRSRLRRAVLYPLSYGGRGPASGPQDNLPPPPTPSAQALLSRPEADRCPQAEQVIRPEPRNSC